MEQVKQVERSEKSMQQIASLNQGELHEGLLLMEEVQRHCHEQDAAFSALAKELGRLDGAIRLLRTRNDAIERSTAAAHATVYGVRRRTLRLLRPVSISAPSPSPEAA